MRSISARVTIVVVAMGLVSSILVGLISQILIEREFKQRAQEQAFERIETDVVAYIASHGSWKRARLTERFDEFRRRRDQNADFTSPFMLVDTEGTIVIDSRTHRIGQTVSADLLDSGRPTLSNGELIATAVAVEGAVLDIRDSEYLATIKSSLKIAVILVVALVLIVGVVLGRRIVAPLRKLVDSLVTELQGRQYQDFELDTQNEVALLNQYIAHLCSDLDQARDKISRTRKTIANQAAKLAEINIRDEITQLHNHRYFIERGQQLFAGSQRSGKPLSCVIADIDRFKQINDKFSHAVGDKVLKKMAEILRSSTRETDIVARYDGGEFVIAFSETPLELAETLCDRLLALVQSCNWAEIHPELSVKLRIGLCADMGLDNFEQMVAVADTKLYLSRGGAMLADAQLAVG